MDEDRSKRAAHTNHDRDLILNGINGLDSLSERGSDHGISGGEQRPTPKQPPIANGVNGTVPESQSQSQRRSQEPGADSILADMAEKLQQLPPEIAHITEGFEPLSKLLQRLTQVTHNRLSAKVMELAAMPTSSPVVNGNGMHHFNGADDNSVDNVRKKVSLIKFAEATHADWTKALVITKWSRDSELVSKVIDLKVHIDKQKSLYDAAFFELADMKRGLIHARLPNPDLKTAAEVLSTGKTSWVSNPRRIDPPPLTAKELLKSLQDMNTLLTIRLNLHEYDKMPLQFKDFSIKSGRATFKVQGEFEVDLTIADENPEEQLWLIDFRFLFTPAVSVIPELLLERIGGRVNPILRKDGLDGCYKFLHELTLTHKINEIKRQAIELSRGIWIETLQVEPLHRSLSIQYWLGRYGKGGPRSWIILGVSSGRRKDRLSPDPKATSFISLRWFRDSKEIKDHGITFDLTTLSAEALLQVVISKHISHILETLYKSLRTKPLFSSKQLSISFKVSELKPNEPELKVQLTKHDTISVNIEPRTGKFAISPALRLAARAESYLNSLNKDTTTALPEIIENLRCLAVSTETINKAISVGWEPVENPGIKSMDLKPIMPRDALQLSWFRRAGWKQGWFVALSASMSGERWWLIEIAKSPELKIITHIQIPLRTTSSTHNYEFLSSLHLYAAALISYYSNLRALHGQRVVTMLQKERSKAYGTIMNLPVIFVKLSDILPSKNKAPRTGKAWAKNVLKITFHGLMKSPQKRIVEGQTGTKPSLVSSSAVQASRLDSEPKESAVAGETAIVVAEACLVKPMPPSLDLVRQRVDKDIAFHPKSGAFAFRLYAQVGEAAIPRLVERLQRVEQLVDFVEIVQKHGETLHCETVSLGQIIFSYGASDPGQPIQPDAMDIDSPTNKHRATINFSGATTPMTMTLEPGNPQIRVLDHLTKTLNSPLGLEGVATLLPPTLQLMAAFDAIEDAWTPLSSRGDVIIFNRAIDWHILRYNLNPESQWQQSRKVMFQIRLQRRKGAWWCIRREKELKRGEQEDSSDDVDNALQTVWDGNLKGETWRGMRHSGIANTNGIEELIRKVDEVMRSITIGATKSGPNVSIELEQKQQQPAPSMRDNANRQIPQSQNGVRNGNGKRQFEAIVID